jgi:hypothetical protein
MRRSRLIETLHEMASDMQVPEYDWDMLLSEKTSELSDLHVWLSEYYAHWVVETDANAVDDSYGCVVCQDTTCRHWPTQDDLDDAVRAFDDGDTSNVLSVSGDLAPMLTEARGWLSDCDVRNVETRDDGMVIHLVSRLYDGGLYAFALANVHL